MRLAVAGIIVLLVAGGCGRLDPLPSDTFYRLAPIEIDAQPLTPRRWTDQTLLVERFKAGGIHKERAIAYLEQDQVSLSQHKYHYWNDSLEVLLQERFARIAEIAGVAKYVVTESEFPAAVVVSGKIYRLEQIKGDPTGGIAIEIEMTARERRGKERLVYKERLEAEELGQYSTQQAVTAISDALDKLFIRFINNASRAFGTKPE